MKRCWGCLKRVKDPKEVTLLGDVVAFVHKKPLCLKTVNEICVSKITISDRQKIICIKESLDGKR